MPKNEFLQFFWPVEVPGYTWATAKALDISNGTTGRPGQYLCPETPRSGGRGEMLYNPLETEPALFSTFASTEPDKDAIAAFARKYGQLGGESRRMVLIDGFSTVYYGESLSAWHVEILKMRRAVALWNDINEENEKSLKRLIKWNKDGGVIYNDIPNSTRKKPDPGVSGFILIARKDHHAELLDRLRPPDVMEPARFALQAIVNKQLKGCIYPQLLLDGEKLRVFDLPDSLTAAMWLQLALAIGGGMNIKKCPSCGASFAVGPGVGRKGKKFCSNSCRAAAGQKRKVKK